MSTKCGCGGDMQPMAYGAVRDDGGRNVLVVCPVCDGDTLEVMWGPLGEEAIQRAVAEDAACSWPGACVCSHRPCRFLASTERP